ncbi:hypothetical protein A4H97_08050 [Niastella yeongjuensis]|uniref:Uncharacterized protein n=1 Tax=Niastella yeongjuensis TaxID=354355 RepID=A0A1V9EMR2_9BACT|nr:hypothetical protein [Niastella yeongjuensis]OQP47437.1 hypothetical protein A4H97_08050 [Niastella yeongjuensis]SEN84177.1 hypothetical protein SAMN05660816_01636 [Niastella yeongjuensis]
MKMRLLSTVGLSALLLTGILFTLHSCNKNPQTIEKHEDDNAALKAEFEKKGHEFTVRVNQKLETFYSNESGQRLSTEVLRQRSARASGRTTSIISACDFMNEPVATFNTYGVSVNCAQNFVLTWNYTISTNNNLVSVNTATGVKTKGTVKITNSSGTTLYSASKDAYSIIDIGADVSNPGYELYSVTFTSDPIDIFNFGGSNTIKLGGTVVTDCDDVESILIAVQSFNLNGINSVYNNPLLRIDAAWVTQVNPIRIFGEDPAGFCLPYVYPSMQQVQYSIDGGVTWIGESANSTLRYWQSPPVSWTTPVKNFINAHLGFVDPVGALLLQIDLPAGSYNVLIRYRNIVYNGTLASYGNIWPLPVLSGTGANCQAGPWSEILSYPVTY